VPPQAAVRLAAYREAMREKPPRDISGKKKAAWVLRMLALVH